MEHTALDCDLRRSETVLVGEDKHRFGLQEMEMGIFHTVA